MTTGSIWVGALELDGDCAVRGLNGPVRDDQLTARLLVCLHGVPLGFVSVPVAPPETLASRAHMAAKSTLAGAVHRHLEWDSAVAVLGGEAEWEARVACPRNFPATGGQGISVVVCTRDRAAQLRECLRTIQQVGYAPMEIIVVDNAPATAQAKDLVAASAKRDPRIRYLCEPQPGLSRARNHGLEVARYELVAFTDDDVLVDPGWLAALAAGFGSDPEAVCVTGFVAASALDTRSERYFDSRYSWGEVSEPQMYDLATHRPPAPLFPFSAGTFGTGANFAVRRDSVREVGGFDPHLGAGGPGRGGEDLDMFLRLILAGGRICHVPAAFVWHRHRSGRRALGEQTYSYGHGLGAYLAKHLSNRDLRLALARHGAAQVRVLAGRTRRAIRESQIGSNGRRLALTEAIGVAAGLLSYHRGVRRSRRSRPGEPGSDDQRATELRGSRRRWYQDSWHG